MTVFACSPCFNSFAEQPTFLNLDKNQEMRTLEPLRFS